MSLPRKCVVDTNVPKTANKALASENIPEDLLDPISACIKAIKHVIDTRGLIIDEGDEIFNEYMKQLSMKGQPGMGDRFMKWVYYNRWKFPKANRVAITKNGNSYNEFPVHEGLANFDVDDTKFVAVANAHPQKPPILQATDCKWWGWRKALNEVGIKVYFLCPEYVEAKYDLKRR